MAVNGASFAGGVPTSGSGSYRLILDVSENTDAANNVSSINYNAYLIKDSAKGYAYLYGNNSNVQVWIGYSGGGGNTVNTNVPYDFYAYNNVAGATSGLASGTTGNIGHDANGALSISVRAYFSGGSGGLLGVGDTGWQTYTLTDYDRSPTLPSMGAPTRASNGTSATITWSGSVNNSGPQVTFNLDRYTGANTSPPGGWGTPQASTAYSGTFTDTGLDTATDYTYRIYAYNTDGAKAAGWQIAYAPPQFSSFTLPQGVMGKPYTGGQVTGTRVDSFAIGSGALPDGLSMNSSGVVSGTPTKPGLFTFTVNATNSWGTQVSPSQSIFIAAGGPWVKVSSYVVNSTISNIAVTSGVATITTSAAHGITETNQPITIAGLTGSGAALNGARIVTSYTTNTFTFNTTAGNISSTSASGTARSYFKRSSLKVRVGGQWVTAYLRVYQASTSSWVFIK